MLATESFFKSAAARSSQAFHTPKTKIFRFFDVFPVTFQDQFSFTIPEANKGRLSEIAKTFNLNYSMETTL